MRRILLSVEYDGTDFSGWQKQSDRRTVQEVIEKALYKVTKKKTDVRGASRTDAGVHSKDQKVVFDTDSTVPTEKFAIALNCVLPKDVVINSADEVETDFNLMTQVQGKTYRYTIYNSNIPTVMNRRYCWQYIGTNKLDEYAMQKAAQYLVGEHDFSAFKSSGGATRTSVRTIYSCNVTREGKFIYIDVTGSGFLYNMVRIIAGTLLEVGINKKKIEDMDNIVKSKDRKLAGITAPPEGLCLEKIYFHKIS